MTVHAAERDQEAADILHRHGGRQTTIPASEMSEAPGRTEHIDRPEV